MHPDKQPHRERDTHIDAIRGVAIILVVWGHLIQNQIGSDQASRLVYGAIYLFHIPLFAFMAGIFARPLRSKDDIKALVSRVILPLVVFDAAYQAYWLWRSGGSTPFSLFTPFWHLWFLLSLLFWRLSLILTGSLVGLVAVIVLALLAGYDSNLQGVLSAARTFYFFPFFIVGYLYGRPIVVFARAHRLASLVVLAALIGATSFLIAGGLSPTALFGSTPYDVMPIYAPFPPAARIALLAMSMAALIAAAGVVPRAGWLARMGSASLSIYVLHAFVLYLMPEFLNPKGPLTVIWGGVLALAIAFALSFANTPFQWFFSWPFQTREEPARLELCHRGDVAVDDRGISL